MFFADVDGFVGAPSSGGELDEQASCSLGGDDVESFRGHDDGGQAGSVFGFDGEVAVEVEGVGDSGSDHVGGEEEGAGEVVGAFFLGASGVGPGLGVLVPDQVCEFVCQGEPGRISW